MAGVLLLCRLLQPSPILQTELGADSSVPLPQAMDHRRAAALLVLSAAAAVLGHTHEEVVVDLGDHEALGGPTTGKVALMGENNGKP